MREPDVLDDQGNKLVLQSVFTYCAAEEVIKGRKCALRFMQQANRAPCNTTADTMLDLRLRPVGTASPPTHYGCIRSAYNNEIEQEREFIQNECAHVPSLKMLTGTLYEVLSSLNLELC